MPATHRRTAVGCSAAASLPRSDHRQRRRTFVAAQEQARLEVRGEREEGGALLAVQCGALLLLLLAWLTLFLCFSVSGLPSAQSRRSHILEPARYDTVPEFFSCNAAAVVFSSPYRSLVRLLMQNLSLLPQKAFTLWCMGRSQAWFLL